MLLAIYTMHGRALGRIAVSFFRYGQGKNALISTQLLLIKSAHPHTHTPDCLCFTGRKLVSWRKELESFKREGLLVQYIDF